MSELISVIIPAYNVELYIDRCMESVVGQTYKNLEIILINEEVIQSKIYYVRGQKVMLDVDLAEIYGYETKISIGR